MFPNYLQVAELVRFIPVPLQIRPPKSTQHKNAILALASAQLPRTGVNSPAKTISQDDLRCIASFLETPVIVMLRGNPPYPWVEIVQAQNGRCLASFQLEKNCEKQTFFCALHGNSLLLGDEDSITKYTLPNCTPLRLFSETKQQSGFSYTRFCCLGLNEVCEYAAGAGGHFRSSLLWRIAGSAEHRLFIEKGILTPIFVLIL